ncbi:MAG: ATP-binding protein [Planctomycetota bacterium]|nr:MAG: ATP-binding protein [Planctomycetota bacterium]
MVAALRIEIASEIDIVAARQEGRALAVALGFSPVAATMVAAAISELARNILLYARRGEIVVERVDRAGCAGVCVTARDAGPGIADLALAMQPGYSTSGGLGLGLPGVQRLMDEFEIHTELARGTLVVARKWREPDAARGANGARG